MVIEELKRIDEHKKTYPNNNKLSNYNNNKNSIFINLKETNNSLISLYEKKIK